MLGFSPLPKQTTASAPITYGIYPIHATLEPHYSVNASG
jgi:hypothetical protein